MHLKKKLSKLYYDYQRIQKMIIIKRDTKSYAQNVQTKSLTVEEKRQLTKLWSTLLPSKKIPQTYYEIIKGFTDFNVEYLPDSIYQTYILPILNPKEESVVFSNKGFYSFYFNEVEQPKEIVKNINGNFFYKENRPCSEDEAQSTILNYKLPFIIKPTTETGSGRNIKIIDSLDGQSDVKQLFKQYGKDFVCQEIVSQSEQTARFNPTSLNTFRITTLMLNNHFSVLSSVFRCGRQNSVVDNAGAGGIMVGVSPSGEFHDIGFTLKGNIRKSSDNGIDFKGVQIREVQTIINKVQQLHEKIPFLSIVGWDIALNKNNRPILIEVNLKCPGIFIEQLCTGPILGTRFSEVMEYIKKTNSNE